MSPLLSRLGHRCANSLPTLALRYTHHRMHRAVNVVRGSWPSETPVGVEPTFTGLQPAAWPSGSSVEYPRQESNLIPDLRRVVCAPPHPEDENIPARIRTGIQTLEESDVGPLHHQDIQEPTAGFAPA